MFCGTKVDDWVGSRVGGLVALEVRDGVKLGSGVFVSVGFKVGVDVVGVEVAVAHPDIPHITIRKNSANLVFMLFSPFEISMIVWPIQQTTKHLLITIIFAANGLLYLRVGETRQN